MSDRNDPNAGVNARFHLVEKDRGDGRIETLEYLEITINGDPKYKRDQKVTLADIERFPDAYQRFKEGVVDTAAGGTPLKDFPDVSIGMINHLNSINIYTVEQLASVNDGNLQYVGIGGQTLRRKAREWLEAQKTQPSYDDLQKQLAEMSARLAAVEKEKRGPGRPRKEQEAA